jgi:hypothetical protein
MREHRLVAASQDSSHPSTPPRQLRSADDIDSGHDRVKAAISEAVLDRAPTESERQELSSR